MSFMTHVSPKVAAKLDYYEGKLSKVKRDHAEAITRVTRTVGTCLTAGTLGYVKGRYNRTELMGAPIAPFIGVAAHIGGAIAGSAKYADHLHTVGDACLAVHCAAVGEEIGRDRATKSGGTAGTSSQAGFSPFAAAA